MKEFSHLTLKRLKKATNSYQTGENEMCSNDKNNTLPPSSHLRLFVKPIPDQHRPKNMAENQKTSRYRVENLEKKVTKGLKMNQQKRQITITFAAKQVCNSLEATDPVQKV